MQRRARVPRILNNHPRKDKTAIKCKTHSTTVNNPRSRQLHPYTYSMRDRMLLYAHVVDGKNSVGQASPNAEHKRSPCKRKKKVLAVAKGPGFAFSVREKLMTKWKWG